MQDFSFQGKVYLGERLSSGAPGALRWVSDVGILNISLSSTEEKRKETFSGQRLDSATLQTGKEATINLTLRHATAKNLALGLYGEVNTIAGDDITAEPFPSPLVVGDIVALARGDISSVVIEDSLAAGLTLDTHYAIESAEGGLIEILDLASFTQPFNADYTHGACTDITMFTQPAPIRYLLLDGVNTVDGANERVKVRLYKCKFNPISQLDLINETFGEIALTGSVLADPLSAAIDSLGPFGRMELLG